MSVKLEVEERCQTCSYFEVTQTNHKHNIVEGTIVFEALCHCKHQKMCEYLRKKFEKEREENKYEKD